MIKVYESKGNIFHSAIILVDGKQKAITFSNGRSDPWQGGRFQTSDKKIMEALEKRKDFDKNFFIVTTQQDEPETDGLDNIKELRIKMYGEAPEPTSEVETHNEDTSEPKDQEVETTKESPEPDMKVIPRITTAQAAKEYLMDNFDDLTHRQVRNKTLILEVAKEKGIYFEDLI